MRGSIISPDLVRILRPTWSLCAVLLSCASPVPAQSGDAGRELAALYREDQADQMREDLADDVMGRRQDARRDRALALVRAGRLASPADYYHAAMLFQHGKGPSDFLLSHLLSTIAAFDGYSDGFFLSAAALDRFMLFEGQAARFGSQTFDAEGKDLGDTSSLLSEAIVQVFRQRPPYPRSGLTGKPLVAEQRTKRRLKAASRALAKGRKTIGTTKPGRDGKLSPATAKKQEALFVQTLEIVEKGQLTGKDDFHRAAVILSHAEGRDRLLMAHVLATTAGLLGHSEARELYARTLDRYLESLGRFPVFSPPRSEGSAPTKPKPEWVPLPASIEKSLRRGKKKGR